MHTFIVGERIGGVFEETSEAAFHMKGVMKQFTVLCLDLIIRILVTITFQGKVPWGFSLLF